MAEDFLDSVHGQLGCMYCHKGRDVNDQEEAHEGLIKDPSEKDGSGICRQCHEKIASTYKDSMHYTLNGILAITSTIVSPHEMKDTLVPDVMDLHCADCHASCGSCHVSRPRVAEAGLLDRHRFQKTPPMDKTCYACHDFSYAGEYKGELGDTADVHYEKLQMACTDCHTGKQLHNTRPEGVRRHYATVTTRCEDCHPEAAEPESSGIAMHNAHPENTLACTVCHSTEYFNCQGCHISLDVKETGGIGVIFSSDPLMTFKIGKNIDRGPNNPYKYNLVRHCPMKKDTMASLRYFQKVLKGQEGPGNLVANYDALPTWNSANPHNIRKKTRQNSSCNSCHGRKDLFLTEDDLNSDEPAANMKIIVEDIPARVKK